MAAHSVPPCRITFKLTLHPCWCDTPISAVQPIQLYASAVADVAVMTVRWGRQVAGAEKILYGLNDIAGKEEVIIVEGEIDKLSLEEAGLTNAVSVPDGAPGMVRVSCSLQESDKFHPLCCVLAGLMLLSLAEDCYLRMLQSAAQQDVCCEQLCRRVIIFAPQGSDIPASLWLPGLQSCPGYNLLVHHMPNLPSA